MAGGAMKDAPYIIGGIFVLAAVGLLFFAMMAAAGFAAIGGGGSSSSGGGSGGGTLSGDCDYEKILQDASAGSAEGTSYFANTGLKGTQPPKEYIPFYQSASDHSKLGGCGPSILAGIHAIETHFGGDDYGTVNSSGAGGPFQFLQATWDSESSPPGGCGGTWPQYGVEKGACAAANYMKNSGAPKSWRDGIYAYNHADWYVTAVVLAAKEFSGATGQSDSDGADDSSRNPDKKQKSKDGQGRRQNQNAGNPV
jgi:hypothetical protein